MIPIFCINLDRAIERRNKIQKEWIDNLGLDIRFWNAYDRRDIEQGKFIYPYDKEKAIEIFKRELSHGEIACSTSFCQLYEYCINNNFSEIIVMEDDITPLFSQSRILFDLIEISKIEFPERQMALLHHLHPIQLLNIEIKNNIYYEPKTTFSLCRQTPWGNQLFYINRNAMQKLYNELIKMTYPADHPQQILALEKSVCIINQPLCYHDWIGENSTTYIGNDFRKTRRNFIK